MTLSLRDANTRFGLLKAFADAIYAEMDNNRAEHTARLVERYEEEGTKSFDIKLPDGTKVGSITLTVPKASIAVTDDETFLKWCQANRPDAVAVEVTPAVPEVVIPAKPEQRREYVNPKAITTILKDAKHVGDFVVTAEGEIIDGVTYRPAPPPSQFSVRYDTDGREALAMAYRRGELNTLASGSALPEIEAAP